MIKIIQKTECCGCFACYNICPTKAIIMKEDEKGFKYPIIDEEKCIKCGLCKSVCPILKKSSEVKKELPISYACKNKNTDVRMKSSSGGIFSLIAKTILQQKGVVFGACFDEKYNVKHSYIESEEDIEKFRGSKYVQSSIGDTYKEAKEFLDNDRYVLFTGTPCQIEGLKAYLKKDYEKLYTQDIICHGVPSPKVWEKYIKEQNQKNGGKPVNINFRKKDNKGWKLFELSIKYDKSEVKQTHKKDIFMKAFLSNTILRDSCYSCSFRKQNRVSDITLADFWGIENINPEFDDDKGVSLVLIHSEKGKKLLSKIENEIHKKEVEFEDAIRYNKSMIESPQMPKIREEFFEILESKSIERAVRKYLPKPNILKRIVRKVKNVLKQIKEKLWRKK